MKCNKLMRNILCICFVALAFLFAPQIAYASDNVTSWKESRTLIDNITIDGEQNLLSDGILVYEFTENKTALKVVKLAGMPAKEIVVPNTRIYGGVEYPVTIIGENGLYLGMHGQTGEKIEKITIPSNVEIIETNGFANLSNLKTVVISKDSKLHTIGDSAFYFCKSLESIKLPNTVTSIGKNAFFLCENLEKITLSTKLKEIKESTFQSCSSLTAVNIPKSVTAIGKDAFVSCSSLEIVTFNKGLKKIGDSAFSGCSNIVRLELPSTLTSIGKSAFENCSSLKDVIFNKGLKKISDSAFLSCSSIIKLELPNTLTSIGKSAFENCTLLKSVNIPSKIKELKSKTFYYTALKQISIPKNLKKISSDTFLVVHSLVLFDTFNVDVYCSKDAYFYKNQKKFKGKSYESYTTEFTFSTKKMPACSKVSFYTNKGEFFSKYDYGTVDEQYVIEYAAAPEVFREGYTFEGWYTKKSGGKKISSGTGDIKVKKDIKLYAHWKKAKTYTVGKYKYRITNPGEVAFAGIKSEKTTKVYIPHEVKIKGKTYKVTAIADKALKNKKKVTYVEVGINVEYIGHEAFRGCSKLAKIKFTEGFVHPATGKIEPLIGSLNLYRTGDNIFKGIKSNAKIYVPKEYYKDNIENLKNKGQGKKVKFKKY